LRKLTAPEGKIQGASTRGGPSAEVSASLRHLSRVRPRLTNIDLAEVVGAVVVTNKRGRKIQAKPIETRLRHWL
jgi:hypothetical protein